MILVYSKNKTPVYVGDTVFLSDGEEFKIKDILAPHKPSSTGRVVGRIKGASYDNEYFPSVIDAEWKDREDQGGD